MYVGVWTQGSWLVGPIRTPEPGTQSPGLRSDIGKRPYMTIPSPSTANVSLFGTITCEKVPSTPQQLPPPAFFLLMVNWGRDFWKLDLAPRCRKVKPFSTRPCELSKVSFHCACVYVTRCMGGGLREYSRTSASSVRCSAHVCVCCVRCCVRLCVCVWD